MACTGAAIRAVDLVAIDFQIGELVQGTELFRQCPTKIIVMDIQVSYRADNLPNSDGTCPVK